ncbi:DUF1772 domain-containing protein [Millisia brevis]|uniref:DUF1772 domain-containing protein n=1 Tax=Millisia brevis TaxID=264148 RepID=UPI000831578C|nr:DUF1772 domain-containing protein [Millisia brevis]
MIDDALRFAALVIVGFTACAEFGSYAFVHPVIRRLPQREHVLVEQGLLGTFGRVMPALMTASMVLAVVVASSGAAAPGWGWAAAGALTAAVVSTLVVNVPINRATGGWDASAPPDDWKRTRNRWERFQGVRSWLLLIGFVALSGAVVAA